LFAERFVEGMSAAAVYRGLVEVIGAPMSRAEVVTAIALAAIAPVVVAEFARMLRERHLSIPTHGRAADVALVTCATLMAVSDLGVEGHGGMGLWGPAVFTIPLLASWYSYDRLGIIRDTYDQTIHALGAAPELGGLVREGHAERVADLSVAVATQLGFSRHELEQLETAALLHHLGQVCLDEPDDGRSPEPVAVAQAGAAVLRGTRLLAPSGDIIAAETMPYREKISSRPSVMSGQILKVASAFDELCEGRSERSDGALEAMFSAPGYAYDSRVLAALEVVLDRRGMLELSR
jgi:HD-GYP domain-containing protein (c-di-GMP phosphodiesterase class II)